MIHSGLVLEARKSYRVFKRERSARAGAGAPGYARQEATTMKAKSLMFVLALTLPAAAIAQTGPSGDPTYHERVQEQYCAKLRESPQAYAQFVHAKRFIHGYTYSDFAALNSIEPAKIDCRDVERRADAAKGPAKEATKMAGKAREAR